MLTWFQLSIAMSFCYRFVSSVPTKSDIPKHIAAVRARHCHGCKKRFPSAIAQKGPSPV